MTQLALFDSPWSGIHVGDARSIPLADDSVDLVVTSPPYFGLRAYGGGEAEIGTELLVSAYVGEVVGVLKECARVLKQSGSIFVVIGDKYVSDNRGSGGDRKRGHKHAPAGPRGFVGREAAPKGSLLGLPWRVAIAAVDAGLYWRQEIVWHKPNPTPDPSGRDRCARAHEAILHLTRSRRYFTTEGGTRERGHDVWSIPVQGYRDPLGRRHPAVYPEALVERVISGWCPPSGSVLDPFAGSGTTVAVANRMGRKAIGFDINPEYVAIAQTRARAGDVR